MPQVWRRRTQGVGIARADPNGDWVVIPIPEGRYTVRLYPPPGMLSLGPAGPATLAGVEPPPPRLYRVLEFTVRIAAGKVQSAVVAPGLRHGDVWVDDGVQIDVDWKPDWIEAPLAHRTSLRHPQPKRCVVLHRTGGNKAVDHDIGPSINRFTGDGEVASAHYLVDIDGHVLKMVQESWTAHHVSGGYWAGDRSGTNGYSVGIEIVNCNGEPCTEEQYVATMRLVRELLAAFGISRHGVVGHADVEVRGGLNKEGLAVLHETKQKPWLLGDNRKDDPGLEFDWERLGRAGLATLAEPQAISDERLAQAFGGFFRDKPSGRLGFRDEGPAIEELQQHLKSIGYSINEDDAVSVTGTFDQATGRAVQRFCYHYFSGRRRNTTYEQDFRGRNGMMESKAPDGTTTYVPFAGEYVDAECARCILSVIDDLAR